MISERKWIEIHNDGTLKSEPVGTFHVEAVFKQISEEALFGEHRDEGGDELVVVVDAAAVVDLVFATLLVLVAKAHVQLKLRKK